MKKKFQIKIASYNKEIEDLKTKFDLEKSDLLDKFNNLNEYVKTLQTQKKDIVNDCELKVNKIRSELINIQDNKVKLFIKSINPIELNQASRYVKIKNIEKPPNTSRTKSKDNLKSSKRDGNSKIASNKITNNSYFMKINPTQLSNNANNNSKTLVSNTYTNGNIKYTAGTYKSRDNSALDIKENMDILKDITSSGIDYIESGHNTKEKFKHSQNNKIKKSKMQNKSNSCLNLLKEIEKFDIKPKSLFGSAYKNNENSNVHKLNDINDLVFNLERSIAELKRNSQNLLDKIKVIFMLNFRILQIKMNIVK